MQQRSLESTEQLSKAMEKMCNMTSENRVRHKTEVSQIFAKDVFANGVGRQGDMGSVLENGEDERSCGSRKTACHADR